MLCPNFEHMTKYVGQESERSYTMWNRCGHEEAKESQWDFNVSYFTVISNQCRAAKRAICFLTHWELGSCV